MAEAQNILNGLEATAQCSKLEEIQTSSRTRVEHDLEDAHTKRTILLFNKTEGTIKEQMKMARRRFQKGALLLRGKKPNQKWIGRWREDVSNPETGQRQRVHRTVVLATLQELPTRKLALRQLQNHLSSINSLDYRPRTTTSFGDFSEQYIATVLPQHKPSSAATAKWAMDKYIVPFFGKKLLYDFTPATVQLFVSSLTLAPKTIRNIYGTFRSAWKTAVKWDLVDRDVCKGIVLPRLNPVERRAFTMEEMKQLINNAKEPFKTMYWLAAETGMRAGEIFGLRPEDIDTKKGIVQVRQSMWKRRCQTPKSLAGQRSFSISVRLCQHLDGCSGKARGGLLFTTRNGRPWTTSLFVERHLRPLCGKLGINPGGIHAFRHGNATALISGGADVKTVAARLGHSDPSITLKIYSHVIQARDRECVEQLSQTLFPTVPNPNPQVVAMTASSAA